MKFRKLPVVIEAVIWNGFNVDVILNFIKSQNVGFNLSDVVYNASNGTLVIPTLEGNMTASSGDYIIRGVKGELYPCKPDIFQATYERVV